MQAPTIFVFCLLNLFSQSHVFALVFSFSLSLSICCGSSCTSKRSPSVHSLPCAWLWLQPAKTLQIWTQWTSSLLHRSHSLKIPATASVAVHTLTPCLRLAALPPYFLNSCSTAPCVFQAISSGNYANQFSPHNETVSVFGLNECLLNPIRFSETF